MDKREKQKRSKTMIRVIAACILLTVSGGIQILVSVMPGLAEWYSVHIYQVLVSVFGRFFGIFPFSVSEICLYILLLVLAASLVHITVKIIRKDNRKRTLMRWLSCLFLVAAVLMFLYTVNCGVNYKRNSFSEKAGISAGGGTVDELEAVCSRLTEKVNACSSLVTRNTEGEMILQSEEDEGAVSAMQKLGKEYPMLDGYYPQPKRLLVSELLSYQGLTGVYSPFTLEANYNGDMLDYNIPFTTCHELSHLRGFMQEDEANFIAFLACSSSDSIDFQYSGYLMGWIYSMNELSSADAERWSVVRSGLAPEAEADLRANSTFWDAYDGRTAKLSNQINDLYLKANGQDDGIKSYNRMVDLMIAYYRDTENKK
ncbi:DUF3810 domain-containing protein [Ruminococcus sp. OA3]|uniref:DUF3810 domain-containing protein n=2 Tax=Oscillospiraceae TaxID=216572 RepID=UPI001F062D3E|nr:DUF3810 domain-containing protein [Ruminococcus sp. OA3]MCH1983796.1 DUF3810 domain-containing protein [Ruminococcus sp. OA3]